MATLATRSFGGTVVDNSYVASQRFNRWLAEARAQAALGWTAQVDRTDDGRIRVALAGGEGALIGATVSGTAHHPVGRAAEQTLAFVHTGGGAYVSRQPLGDGRWIVGLAVSHQGREARFVRDLNQ
jgi:nitrogen fixation protein FixH